MSKLTMMLKWAMRIVAVGGALLALAVGTVAGMHRTQGQRWTVATPAVWLNIIISPKFVNVCGLLRRPYDPGYGTHIGRFGIESQDWENRETEHWFTGTQYRRFDKQWHGFSVVRGQVGIPSLTALLCPTWALTAVLLLPSGLCAGIGWWQRRRVKAGYCIVCRYDLRASPERCPECGTAAKTGAKPRLIGR